MEFNQLPSNSVKDRIRVTDLDFQQHMGNTAFTDIFANARFVFLSEHVRPKVGAEKAFLVLVHLNINFIGQVHHPAEVETTTIPMSVGRTSLRLQQQMRWHEEVVAEAEAVMVLADRETGKSLTWPAEIAAWSQYLQGLKQSS